MSTNNPKAHDRTPEPGAPSEIEQLRTLLYTDDLTSLYNRRFFRHCVAEQKSQSDSAAVPFALLIMDVDHFKQINDSHGHAIGDQALIQIAGVLKEQIRERGWVFRYAGDEFVAIVRNGDDAYVRTFCNRILQNVEALTGVPSLNGARVSLSIGYAIYPNDTRSISDLLEAADRALYASKSAGRNTVHSVTEATQRETETLGEWPVPVHCPSLIGRQAQWNQLQQHFFEVRSGHGRLLFVTGEAGIGKSRLIRHFIRRQRNSDYHFLLGECTEATIVHSYAPIRDALKKGFEAKDPATVNVYKELPDSYRKVLLELVPQFDRFEKAPLIATGPSDRYFLLESILLLLQGLARQLPAVFILEDIHWSDEATLSLLQFLAKSISKEKILVIATLREEEALNTAIPVILQNMSRENLFEKIEVKALNRDESALMVSEIFRGRVVSETLQNWLSSESEGVPFYIEELLKLLLEEGYIQQSPEELRLRTPDKFILPYSIRALVQRRILRLDESLRKLLQLASIVGKEFELKMLAHLTGENEGQLLDLLETLTRMEIIREVSDGGEERYAFCHNKIRDVIYEEIGHIRRKKFHRKVADVLEEFHGNEIQLYAEDLAYHFENAGEPSRAGYYALISGKKALQVHAYQDAFHHFHRCFQYDKLNQDPSTIFSSEQLEDLYTNQGMALEALGRWDEAIQSYELLFSLSGGTRSSFLKIDAWNHLSRVFYKRENFSKSLSLADFALKEAVTADYRKGICEAHRNMGCTCWRISNYEKALQHVDAAIELSNLETEAEQRCELLNSKGVIQLERSRYAEAQLAFEEALQQSQQTGNRNGIVESLVNMSLIEHQQGKLNDARRRLINAFTMAQESGDPVSIAACSVNQAELEFKLANYELGKRLNERAGKIYQDVEHSQGMTYFLENESHSLMVRGRLEAALESTQKARSLAENRTLRKRRIELLKEEANLYYLMGRYEDSFATLDQMATDCREIGDTVCLADAQFRRGLYCVRLNDLESSIPLWQPLLNLPEEMLSADLRFMKTAALAFIACAERKEPELLQFQRQMKKIADATDYAYLMVGVPVLSAQQMEYLGHLPEALRLQEDAEKQALYYNQEVWLPRVRVRIYELQKALRRNPSIPRVYELLEMARSQHQNHMIHRCYQLLWEIDPQFERLLDDWKRHWETWQNQIPERYRASLRPMLEEL